MLGVAVAALLMTSAMAQEADQWKMSLAGGGAIQTEAPSDATIGGTVSLARDVKVVIPYILGSTPLLIRFSVHTVYFL